METRQEIVEICRRRCLEGHRPAISRMLASQPVGVQRLTAEGDGSQRVGTVNIPLLPHIERIGSPPSLCAGIRTPIPWVPRAVNGWDLCRSTLFCSSFRRYRFSTLHSVLLCSCTKCLVVSRAPMSPGGGLERFETDVDAISASYSYFNALIGSTRDARCAGMKPAHSATSATATAESASTVGSAPVI